LKHCGMCAKRYDTDDPQLCPQCLETVARAPGPGRRAPLEGSLPEGWVLGPRCKPALRAKGAEEIEEAIASNANALRASGQYPVVTGPYPNVVRVSRRGPARDIALMEFNANLGFAFGLLVALSKAASKWARRLTVRDPALRRARVGQRKASLEDVFREEVRVAWDRYGVLGALHANVPVTQQAQADIDWILNKHDDHDDRKGRLIHTKVARQRINELPWVKRISRDGVTLSELEMARKEFQERHELRKYSVDHPR